MSGPSIALASLSIRDFRRIECLDLDFCGPDGNPNQLIVIAGPNGCGKTTILEAAILSAGGFMLITGPRDQRAIRIGAKEYEIRARRIVDGSEEEVTLGSSTQRTMSMIQILPALYFSSWRAPQLIGPVNVTVGKLNDPGNVTRTTVNTTTTMVGTPGRESGSKSKRNSSARTRQDRLGILKQQLVNAAARDRFAATRDHFRDEEWPPIRPRYYQWIEQTEPPPAGSRWVPQSAESPTAVGSREIEDSDILAHSTTADVIRAHAVAQPCPTYWKWSPEGEGF